MPHITTIDLAPLDFRAAIGAVDAEARTFELVFSTGAPVMRFDWRTGKQYLEQLSMQPKHVRLGRLNAGAPLLNSHSAFSLADQIGVVEDGTARIEGGKGMATVRFSRRAEVAPILQDVRDKVLRNVSIGYRVHKFEETAGRDGGLAVRRAVDWEPFEISIVPMPADAGAQLRRAELLYPCVIVQASSPAMDARYAHMSRADADAARLRRFKLAKARC